MYTNLVGKRVVRLSERDSQGNRTVVDAGNVAVVAILPAMGYDVHVWFIDDNGHLTAVERNDRHSYRYFEPASNHKVGDKFIDVPPEPEPEPEPPTVGSLADLVTSREVQDGEDG